MNKEISTVFFDIDGVIFDRDSAEKEAVFSVLKKECNILKNDYLKVWKKCNKFVWNECQHEKITAEKAKLLRWQLLLKEYDKEISENRAYICSQQYYQLTCNKKYLVKGIDIVLKECMRQGMTMGIITNGFENVQRNKLIQCGLINYFSEIITEKKTGYRKPDIRIYNYALDCMNIKAPEMIYIGNSYENDIIPTSELGINVIWFDCNWLVTDPKYKYKKNIYLASDVTKILPIIDYIRSM